MKPKTKVTEVRVARGMATIWELDGSGQFRFRWALPDGSQGLSLTFDDAMAAVEEFGNLDAGDIRTIIVKP